MNNENGNWMKLIKMRFVSITYAFIVLGLMIHMVVQLTIICLTIPSLLKEKYSSCLTLLYLILAFTGSESVVYGFAIVHRKNIIIGLLIYTFSFILWLMSLILECNNKFSKYVCVSKRCPSTYWMYNNYTIKTNYWVILFIIVFICTEIIMITGSLLLMLYIHRSKDWIRRSRLTEVFIYPEVKESFKEIESYGTVIVINTPTVQKLLKLHTKKFKTLPITTRI